MTKEFCLTHGLILPCHDCIMVAMATNVCPTCKAPVGNHETLDDGNHADPIECSALLGSFEYRREEIVALELDPADYPVPSMSVLERHGHMAKKRKRDGHISSNPNCGVLGCFLPRDEAYRDDAGGYFCWCTLHGQWYAVRRALAKEWMAKLVVWTWT